MEVQPLKMAIVGLGKMGVSHFAIANALDNVRLVGVCDQSTILGQMVERYSGVRYFPDFNELIGSGEVQAIVIATPTRLHESMVRKALERGIHVLCEKPMTLSSRESEGLGELAQSRGLVGQVGYHNRYVGTFGEVRRLLDLGIIGRIRHIQAEAYGPVVLKPTAKTWRSKSDHGGGCLYDYAAHPMNLMNWYLGRPVECIGADLTQQYSTDVDDAVYAELRFAGGVTGQVSVNWSDDSVRKMTTRLSIWGDGGKIVVDRQELQVFANGKGAIPEGYNQGWTVRYITDLTPNVSFYLRGEEYSAQVEGFVAACLAGQTRPVNDFASAAETDLSLEMIRARSLAEPPAPAALGEPPAPAKSRGMFAKVLGR